jgi:hypothetical protein
MAVYNEDQAEELKSFGLNTVECTYVGDEKRAFVIGFADSDSVTPRQYLCVKCCVNPATEGSLRFDCCGIQVDSSPP